MFRRIVSSANPGRDLLEVEHGPLPTNADFKEVVTPANMQRFARISVDTNIRALSRPHSRSITPPALDANEFEVAVLLAKWTCIVVPGYGLGWILSEPVMPQRLQPSRCIAISASDDTSVSSEVLAGPHVKIFERTTTGHQPMAGVHMLLKMIGHGLEGLNLSCHGIDNDDLRSILSSCPNLTRLNIADNRMSDISALAGRYRANECKLEFLAIRSLRADTQVISGLAELLADPCSKPLRYINADSSEGAEPLEKLATALQVNRRLRFLSLSSVGDEGFVQTARSAFETSPQIQQNLSARLAFLSAIQRNEAASSVSLELLDPAVIASIFLFAAFPIPRNFFSFATFPIPRNFIPSLQLQHE